MESSFDGSHLTWFLQRLNKFSLYQASRFLKISSLTLFVKIFFMSVFFLEKAVRYIKFSNNSNAFSMKIVFTPLKLISF